MKKSELEIVKKFIKYIEESNISDWDEEQVSKRNNYIAEKAYKKIWSLD